MKRLLPHAMRIAPALDEHWRPLVELTRRRHLRFRERLAAGARDGRTSRVVSAGV
jgi:hypothetical protein